MTTAAAGCSSPSNGITETGRSAAAQREFESGSDWLPAADSIEEMRSTGRATSVADGWSEPSAVALRASWEMTGQIPSEFGITPANNLTSIEETLDALRNADATEQARCVAEHYARYEAEFDEGPSGAAGSFIERRCGLTSTGVYVRPIDDGNAASATFLATMLSNRSFFDQSDSREIHLQVGEWQGEINGVAERRLAISIDVLEIEPGAIAIRGDSIRVEGRAPRALAGISGQVTRGPWDAGYCTRDERVRMPRFALDCELDGSDELAVIDVIGFEPNELLGSSFASVMVSPSGDSPAVLHISDLETGELYAQTTGTVEERVVAFANALRRAAGRPPLEFLPEQSEVNNDLLPLVINSATEAKERDLEESEVRNIATIAALAGHRVPTTILDSDLVFEPLTATSAGLGFFAEFQFDPSARMALMSENLNGIAVATHGENTGTTLLVTTFGYFVPQNMAAVQQRFIDRINEARAAEGNRPLVDPNDRLATLLNAAGGSLEIGEYTTQEVLNIVAREASSILGSSVHVYMAHTGNLDAFEVPSNLITGSRRAAVNVSTRAEPQTNWRRYTVLYVTWG